MKLGTKDLNMGVFFRIGMTLGMAMVLGIIFLGQGNVLFSESNETKAVKTELTYEGDVPGHKTASEMATQDEHIAYSAQAVIAKELEEVGIAEQVGKTLEGRMIFTNRHGDEMDFATVVAEEKPILLSFFYATCPSLCQYVLQAKTKMMTRLGLTLGEDFIPVTLSFDSDDTVENIESSYQGYMELLRQKSVNQDSSQEEAVAAKVEPVEDGEVQGLGDFLRDEQWLFLRGDDVNILKLTTQLGFLFKRIAGGEEEFAHTAAMYVITPNGKISRYFYGILFPPFDVKMALIEAKGEQTRTTLDRVLLYCYRYDSDAGEYVLFAQNLMKVGGLVFILLLGALFWFMMRIEKNRRDDLVLSKETEKYSKIKESI